MPDDVLLRRGRRRAAALAVGLACGAAGLAGCGSGLAGGDGRLRVEAAFEPLAWVAEEVGGDRVDVHDLTPPGAEPHDLELSPRDVAILQEADLVVLVEGFQPAVDEAAAGGRAPILDALAVAGDPPAASGGHEERDGHEDGDGHDRHPDPHLWLDPTRLARVATAVGERLAALDPAGADGYRRRATDLVARLDELDGELRAGLRSCAVRTLVTSHEAFGWFARRYDLQQVGIAGISPDREPSPATLARVVDLVEDRGVTTVYTEALVDPAVARTVADEAGVATAVLDPVETITDRSAGRTYLEVMRANLATLRRGQRCR